MLLNKLLQNHLIQTVHELEQTAAEKKMSTHSHLTLQE